MLSDKDLITQFERHRSLDTAYMSSQHATAKEDHEFFAGDSMYYEATVNDKGAKRAVVFNKVKPYVDAVVGTMIQMRRKPNYQARIEDSEAQQVYSFRTNSLSDYARENANLDYLETWQDREMMITGYGAIDTNVAYEKNPDGEVVAEVIRYDEIFWDGEAKEPNLLDARWVRRIKAFSKEEIAKRFDVPIEEFEAYDGNNGGRVQYNPGGGEYTGVIYGAQNKDLLQVNYYQWWELMPYWRGANPALTIQDPEMQAQFLSIMNAMVNNRYELSDDDDKEDLFELKPDAEYLSMTPVQKADIEKLCEEFGVPFKPIKQKRRCFYTAIVTGKKVIRKFKSQNQEGFTIKFKTANYDTNRSIWFGIVRALKNPQEYANKALTEILYTIASNSKGGVMYEKSAVRDPRRFEQQYAQTTAAIQVEDGALTNGRIQPKAQASLPTGYENVYQIADSSMSEVSGISREFLGTAVNKQVAALLESQRINQVLATLATYFDAVSLYTVEHARLMLTYLRVLAENNSGRLVRIIGEDGAAQYKRFNVSMMAEEYDVVISETPSTPAQKERTTEIMLQFGEKLAQGGKDISPILVNYLPIPYADKQKILKAITPDPQAAQQQQAAAQQEAAVQSALNKALADATAARAQKDMADSQLKIASLAETVASADKVRAETAKILEETSSLAAQTQVMQEQPVNSVNVTI